MAPRISHLKTFISLGGRKQCDPLRQPNLNQDSEARLSLFLGGPRRVSGGGGEERNHQQGKRRAPTLLMARRRSVQGKWRELTSL